MRKPITLAEYDPSWVSIFETLRDFVTPALADIVVKIEHVGSTAVRGLVAKPIIDMDVVVSSKSDIPVAVQSLESLGYIYEGDLGVTGREAFTSPVGLPTHHLYVCAVDNAELRRHLLFRDYLRSHPDDAKIYGELKRALAQRFSDDRESYTIGKSDFVNERLRLAGWKA